MRNLLAGIAAAGATLAFAGAAAAKTTYYFGCHAGSPVQNLTAGNKQWTPTAPTKSYQEATGCLHADPGLLINGPAVDIYHFGEHTGEIRGFDLTLFSQTQGSPINGTLIPKTIVVTAIVDDEAVLTEAELDTQGVPAATQQGFKYTYEVRDLDLPAQPKARTIELQIGTYYADDVTPWVWGAKEFPAGITFLDSVDLPPLEDEQDPGA